MVYAEAKHNCKLSASETLDFYMSLSPRRSSPLKRPSTRSNVWLKNTKSLKHVIFTMQLQSLTKPSAAPPFSSNKTLHLNRPKADKTLVLSDGILLRILSKLPKSQRRHNSLVCKRWLNLQGRLVHSLRLLEWDFLESGRLIHRFPNLTDVDLVHGCLVCPRDMGIILSHKLISIRLDPDFLSKGLACENYLLPDEDIDRGLSVLASGCPNLRKLVIIATTELGLLNVAEECPTLQELELHRCKDSTLRAIAAFENLQILKLIGNVDGVYGSLVSDIGLTILAQGCKRLVKLELIGCGGSYDGIKAIGQCCPMLEELTFSGHNMDSGWLAGLSSFENLKILKFQSCRVIDNCLGRDERMGFFPALERIHLQRCHLGDKQGIRALFMVCAVVREIVIQSCWGLENDMLSMAINCGRVKLLCLEGCSLLTAKGLESILLYWKDLEELKVVSCNNIKEDDLSPSLSASFSALKDFKWRPDTKSLVSTCSAGSTGMGKRGSRFFL